jgi:pathogenesis-related protein 1
VQGDVEKCGAELRVAKEAGDATSYRLATVERAEREMKQQLEQALAAQAGNTKLAVAVEELLRLAQKRKAQPVKASPPLQQEAPTPAPPAAKELVPEVKPEAVAVKTDAERWIDAHSKHRAMVGVQPLTWSTELEKEAGKWAEYLAVNGCKMQHSDSRGKYGENLHVGSQPVTPERVTDSWASESKYYDYETNSCSDVCGHYTQVVWKKTSKLGCKSYACTGEEVITVCMYGDEPGNYIGQKPY